MGGSETKLLNEIKLQSNEINKESFENIENNNIYIYIYISIFIISIFIIYFYKNRYKD